MKKWHFFLLLVVYTGNKRDFSSGSSNSISRFSAARDREREEPGPNEIYGTGTKREFPVVYTGNKRNFQSGSSRSISRFSAARDPERDGTGIAKNTGFPSKTGPVTGSRSGTTSDWLLILPQIVI